MRDSDGDTGDEYSNTAAETRRPETTIDDKRRQQAENGYGWQHDDDVEEDGRIHSEADWERGEYMLLLEPTDTEALQM